MEENSMPRTLDQAVRVCLLTSFVLYPFPAEGQRPETRKEWIKTVNRKDAKTKKNWQLSEDSRVCSVHFPEGKQTEAFPSPSINLSATGREKPLKRKRPPPKSRAPYQGPMHPLMNYWLIFSISVWVWHLKYLTHG